MEEKTLIYSGIFIRKGQNRGSFQKHGGLNGEQWKSCKETPQKRGHFVCD